MLFLGPKSENGGLETTHCAGSQFESFVARRSHYQSDKKYAGYSKVHRNGRGSSGRNRGGHIIMEEVEENGTSCSPYKTRTLMTLTGISVRRSKKGGCQLH